MRLWTLWKIWDDNNVELLFALDEYTVEGNWEAWEKGVKDACEGYKITEADTRIVKINIDAAPIAALFEPVEIAGVVEAADA